MFPNALQTARLTLRPITAADARPIFETYAQDPDVTRFITSRPHQQIAETEAYIARCLAAATARTYVLVGHDSDQVLGAFDLRQPEPWQIGYGYALARACWGRGLMTEVLTQVVRWALAQPDIWRIGDVCDVENLASARVMEKAGLTFEGTLRRWSQHPNVSNEPRDCFSFAKTR